MSLTEESITAQPEVQFQGTPAFVQPHDFPIAEELRTLKTLEPERSEKALVNRIVLQKMLQQALQVDNPTKEWFADIIHGILVILGNRRLNWH